MTKELKINKTSATAENATSCVLCSVWQPVPWGGRSTAERPCAWVIFVCFLTKSTGVFCLCSH